MNHSSNKKFVSLYNKEADNVYRFCLMRVSDKDTALDLLQDTFMKFWNATSSGESIRNEKAFLFRIARNLVIDFYRKKKAVSLEGMSQDNTDDVPITFKIEDESVDISLGSEARMLMAKIDELSDTHREVIYLRFIEGLKPKEIAEALDESANTISVRLNRAIKELKEIAGYDIEE